TLNATTNTGDVDVTNSYTGSPTTSAAAVTTTGRPTVVTPAFMAPYVTKGAALLIGAGLAGQETVTITAVTASTFTATFANTHAANFAIAPGPLTLSASTSSGNINVFSNYGIDLASEMSSTAGVVLPSISAPGTVTLTALGGAIGDEGDSTVSAST